MGKTRRRAAALALLVLAACGSGGGSTSGGSGTGAQLTGTLQLLDGTPADEAVQVALDSALQFRFDGALALECFQDEDTWLHTADSGSNVPGTFSLTGGNQTVVFHPDAPLQPETDYVFQLSPLTCDVDGRILERTVQVRFRSLDERPPVVSQATVSAGAQNVPVRGSFTVTFSEAVRSDTVRATSVYLRDVYGQNYPLDLQVQQSHVLATPPCDLPGDRSFLLAVQGGSFGVRDRAGNAMAQNWNVSFRTAPDPTAPVVTGTWPGTGANGKTVLLQPEIRFSKSMDPGSVEPSSLVFQDEFATIVPYRVRASRDQRALRIEPQAPLQPGRQYTLAFVVGPAAACDVSGNPLAGTAALVFRTGSDQEPPTVASSRPGNGETRISPNAAPTVVFQEPLDPAFVDGTRVQLSADGTVLTAVTELIFGGTVLRITPALDLPTAAHCTITLLGGPEGLHDLAGNPLAQDVQLTFTTSGDGSLPQCTMLPSDGAVAVPVAARISILFSEPVDPTTVTAATVQLLDDQGAPQPGTLTLGRSNRVVAFQPTALFSPGAHYRTVVRGGPDGVREQSGNWFADDQTAGFRAGSTTDATRPTVRVTLNRVEDARKSGQVVPPSGFTVDVEASDPIDRSLDPGSFRLELQGPAAAPADDIVYETASVGWFDLHWQVPAVAALPPGDYQLIAHVSDLSGNEGRSEPLAFHVAAPTGGTLPFERTQVVWVRTDLDRDGNGRPDFDDDLVRLGLEADGDPQGQNARMRKLVLDGIFAEAYRLFGRGPHGEVLGPDSVAIRLTARQPLGVPHMQIALGGFDPEGARNRHFGDQSTGILGRAFFDGRNSNVADRDIGTSPGLGVFPGEMFLYQVGIHLQVYPSFQTLFAQRFLPLQPDMGGTPAGLHAEDHTVLDPAFVWNSASSVQRARWQQLFQACDDWATVTGVVTAHEIGHSVGLTAPGPLPGGLYGDNTFHNQFSGATEVMAASVGYESMITMSYAFGDVNLAYLRQRVLLP
jgi:hypothetical protein